MKALGLWEVQWESQGHVLGGWVGIWSEAKAKACVTAHKCLVFESVGCTQSRWLRLSAWTEQQTSNKFSTWAFDVGSLWPGVRKYREIEWRRLEPQAWGSGHASASSPFSCCFMGARFLGSKMVARSSLGESRWPWWDLTVRSMGDEDTPDSRIDHGTWRLLTSREAPALS